MAPPLDRFRLLTAGRGRVAMAGGYGGAMAIEGGEDTRLGASGQAEPGRLVTGE